MSLRGRAVCGLTFACLFLLVPAPAAWAQQTHVINKSARDQAVQQRVNQEQADREALRSFLQNPQVKSVAAKAVATITVADAGRRRRARAA